MKAYLRKLFDSKWFFIFALLFTSVLVHTLFFGHPSSVVFDEVHIGNYISNYLESSYFFDVHPPLGKLIFAFFAYVFGGDISSVDFTKIGNILPDWVIYLRLIPIAAGIALPIIIYGILRYLNISKKLAFLGGILMCLENSLILQSRLLMVDSLILLFGFLSLLLYLVYRRKTEEKMPAKKWLFFALLSAIACFSIKWIGLSFFAFIILFEIYHNYKERGRMVNLKSFKFIVLSGILFLVFYISVFAIHFYLVPKPGPGDAYMSKNFQQKDFAHKFVELHAEMVRANKSLTTPHQYSSAWYIWPLMTRPIYYWNATSTVDGVPDNKYIYFLGNPLLYWSGALAVLLLLFAVVFKFKKLNEKYATLFVLIGFLANFLPFILIGRIMFLYHYAPALVFSIIAIIVLLNKMESQKTQKFTYVILLLVAIFLFIFFSPLTYGLSLSDQELGARMWVGSWR